MIINLMLIIKMFRSMLNRYLEKSRNLMPKAIKLKVVFPITTPMLLFYRNLMIILIRISWIVSVIHLPCTTQRSQGPVSKAATPKRFHKPCLVRSW